MEINPDDLKVEVIRPTQGGQHVGSYQGIKITHIPSGLTAMCDTERSQHRNKQIAMDMILGGLTSPSYRS